MSVDQITQEHHQRVAGAAEQYFAAVQRGERGTPLEWYKQEFSNALTHARNEIGISKVTLEAAMEQAIAKGDARIFRNQLPGAALSTAVQEAVAHAAPAVHAVEEAVEHAAPVARESRVARTFGGIGHAMRDMRSSLGEALSFGPRRQSTEAAPHEMTPAAVTAIEEPHGLSGPMEHYVEHQPVLSPAVEHVAPVRPAAGFVQKIRGVALGGALATSSLPAVATDTHGEIWRGAPLEPVAHRAHVDAVRPPVVDRLSPVAVTRRVESALPPVGPVAEPTAHVHPVEPVPTLAETATVPHRPASRILSDTPFGPPLPAANVPATALPVLDEPALSRGQRMKQTLRKLWPFGGKLNDAADIPMISNAPAPHASNGGIILPEIGSSIEAAAETKGRTGLIVAGTLAAVGGAAFLASGGQHQQREYQRRLDAAALSQDQGIA